MLVSLAPDHAAAAARLHIAGQPGTFLTSLGPEVLTVLYEVLPQTTGGFGFAALTAEPDGQQSVVGFVAATTGTGKLFLEMGGRQLGRFAPALLKRVGQQPSLALRSLQTLAYPLLAHARTSDPRPVAELLSIMVDPAARGQGVGAQLLTALCDACHRREVSLLDVTVDAANEGARRFYQRHGFTQQKEFQLYGRAMCLYRRDLAGDTHV